MLCFLISLGNKMLSKNKIHFLALVTCKNVFTVPLQVVFADFVVRVI